MYKSIGTKQGRGWWRRVSATANGYYSGGSNGWRRRERARMYLDLATLSSSTTATVDQAAARATAAGGGSPSVNTSRGGGRLWRIGGDVSGVFTSIQKSIQIQIPTNSILPEGFDAAIVAAQATVELGERDYAKERVSSSKFVNMVQEMTYTNVVASPHGAKLTNMLFMNRDSRVMEFFQKRWLELVGTGQYVHHWMAEQSGMNHQGAWSEALDSSFCPPIGKAKQGAEDGFASKDGGGRAADMEQQMRQEAASRSEECFIVPKVWKVLAWFRSTHLELEIYYNPYKFNHSRRDETILGANLSFSKVQGEEDGFASEDGGGEPGDTE
ncbi:hypothetical protein Tsubulata_003792 [Turnera subulata]|uniref:Uncharacterized protein n=1 Tax=Turnera subulata TaxID=218843 RepID=A0A9Q0G5B1_9ROSI|nr:hypothetical protein Tsubulata_003792 [Turnera subulata]